MKKNLLPLTALGLSLMLISGCQTAKPAQPETSAVTAVAPYENTEETRQLLRLFPDSFSTYIFDYTLDASVNRLTLTVQTLTADKTWETVDSPEISDPLSRQGQILIQYTQKGELNCSFAEKDGGSAYSSYDALPLNLDDNLMRGYLPQTKKVVGELDKPIPLVLILAKDGSTMETADLETALTNPENLDCDEALLVTLTFSK